MGQGIHRPSIRSPRVPTGGWEVQEPSGGEGQPCGLPLQKEIITQKLKRLVVTSIKNRLN